MRLQKYSDGQGLYGMLCRFTMKAPSPPLPNVPLLLASSPTAGWLARRCYDMTRHDTTQWGGVLTMPCPVLSVRRGPPVCAARTARAARTHAPIP